MNAVVVLTRGYKNKTRYDTLLKRNKSLEKYHNKNISYIIFHEGNIPKDHQEYIQADTFISLIFTDVSDSFRKEKIDFYRPTKTWKLGYRNMCNFWFCDFWIYLHKYDKILRVDEDCIIYFDYNDIFEILDNKVCVYGKWIPDSKFVTKGLNNFTINFMKQHKKEIISRRPSGPYTNVVGLSLLKMRKNVLLSNYIEAIKKSDNIYIYRWGDLPLLGEALTYFFPENSYICLKEIKYSHASWVIN